MLTTPEDAEPSRFTDRGNRDAVERVNNVKVNVEVDDRLAPTDKGGGVARDKGHDRRLR